ncbi:MAG: G1 family glutamic endopeptidase, partial [Acidimicrobiales bacterium]
MRPATTTFSSDNWSGYVVGGGAFTAVQGTFTVPSLYSGQSSSAQMAEWVGIDGASNSSLIQAGIWEYTDPSNPNYFYVYPWWEILPASETPITTMTVQPGDQITVAIAEIYGGEWSITLTDNTTGQSFTTDQPYNGPLSSSEWIVEAPTYNGAIVPLAQYTPTSFSNLGMTGTQTSLTEWIMFQNGVQVSTPSALTSNGFGVTYGTPPPPTPPSASTGAATAVGTTSATLNGTADPHGSATTYQFQYGTTTAYGSVSPNT